MQSPELGNVSLRIVCGPGSQRLLFTTGQLCLQRFRYSFSDLALDDKDIAELSIIRLGPELRTGLHVNQANIDPHLIGRFLHATLNNVSYAKLLRDLRQLSRFARIPLRRGARNNL